nr:flagellar assembly protein T N-terminal domain-containing protein [Bowmanella dokdonensis]
MLTGTSQATWFEASGQAVVVNGDQQQARQMATQEAIKQALLFAGARVSSVQRLANGLLQDDRLEIRASGEVDRVELLHETYQDDIVTVSIRADIFPQGSQCPASSYQKTITTAWYPIRNKRQATMGQIFDLGKALPQKLRQEFELASRHAQVQSVQNFYQRPNEDRVAQAMGMVRRGGGQLVLIGEITDLSDVEDKGSMLTFWKEPVTNRSFGLEVHLFNGMTGELLMHEQLLTSAPWQFDRHASIDPHSLAFWQSSYGLAIQNQLQELAQRIDEEIACLPAYGRVLQSGFEQLTIDMGSQQGISQGDRLRVFKLKQFQDPRGNNHYQYFLHPVEVQVTRALENSAIVESIGGEPLTNIQPNDFVARR